MKYKVVNCIMNNHYDMQIQHCTWGMMVDQTFEKNCPQRKIKMKRHSQNKTGTEI